MIPEFIVCECPGKEHYEKWCIAKADKINGEADEGTVENFTFLLSKEIVSQN
jgi:hypothetical protein